VVAGQQRVSSCAVVEAQLWPHQATSHVAHRPMAMVHGAGGVKTVVRGPCITRFLLVKAMAVPVQVSPSALPFALASRTDLVRNRSSSVGKEGGGLAPGKKDVPEAREPCGDSAGGFGAHQQQHFVSRQGAYLTMWAYAPIAQDARRLSNNGALAYRPTRG
jgi:hypothetical protein